MRSVRVAWIMWVCFAGAGCGLGPQHLDAFYSTRDHYQRLIDKIESEHKLVSRDAGRRAQEVAELDAKRAVQAQGVDARRKEEEERQRSFDAWFATLTPEQRFQWMLAEHQARIQREMEKEKQLAPAGR